MTMEGKTLNLLNNLEQWRETQTQEDEEEIQDSPSPYLGSSSSSSETYMVGFVIVHIVGLQYYTGRISGREMVGLVREPLNPYDSNAIKVLNTRSIQVGHIDRSSAAVLSPLLDANLITIEGIVPNNPSKAAQYKLSCQIHIFARVEAFPTVKSEISRGGLYLISDVDPSFGLSESVIVKEKKENKEITSVDEIFKLVAEENTKGVREVLEPPKEIIKSELFLHQKEGLGWLVHRENSLDLPPFWKEKDGQYVNVLTNYETNKRPEPMRGGIFADDMGLGKTLTLLSLIATNKHSNTVPYSLDTSSGSKLNNLEVEEEKDEKLPASAGKRSKRGKSGYKVAAGLLKKWKVNDNTLVNSGKGQLKVAKDDGSCVLGAKTTLIVCPPSVFSSWITQLGEHTVPGSFNVYMYHGERTNEAEKLRKFDIVLTTYSTLAIDAKFDWSPIKQIEWWRVILDEAHLIKNVEANQSEAVINLKAKRRWVVTGTPIQNGSSDLFSLMAFLKFQPFSIKSYWQSLVQRPLDQGNESGLSRLQILMSTISLRRTKDKNLIELPSKTFETCFVELSPEEREHYNQMEAVAKRVVKEYIRINSVTRNYSTVLSIILRLRQICVDVALCPDMNSLLLSNSIEDVSNNPELLKKMVTLLQDGDDFDCPICISPPINTIITCCAHIFCRACILKTLRHQNARCPLCRHPLREADLFSAPPDLSDSENLGSSSGGTLSSKVSALLKLLVASRAENPTTKSVVFSQFRKMLILLEKPLKSAGFNFLRLDGSMSAKRRANVIQEFGDSSPGTPTILLASLKASGAGINLTAASRVYLVEPWWNPAVEEQAMDRVHRIGQKEDVKIVRLITRNSIEEKILELQERKKTLAREAFGRKRAKDKKQMRVDDLCKLMSL
ncbi:putative SWI/SNF-related matrix-associated actin-dependent regulator of chromatin subfamily A member 3-like 1 [Macadamia integrifolia]|uniref:putative SWI/SNF-related matrix-associated actin-dependent regulator of chromatin subfamily A member 3-like 1 n=1 Tax=Macadamia integrifolia TaxID=60698 RepID=UPI001C4EA660|nr:putative SWI/SNF-related matrix-associated actin-dependent regulator of chromatin subfamily A member 3-like 1 [Macadamia integrifolia]